MSFTSAGTEGTVPQFKKFVSEDELEEKRKIRQEEWEKVRTPDQPLEAPEEILEDNRCLFEKLEEQKVKKQEEYEEQWKLKNQVKGLETEEAEFLDYVSHKQIEIEQNREKENEEVLQDLRNAVVNQVVDKTKGEEKKSLPTKQSPSAAQPKKSQLSMLAGAIKRKSTDVTPEDPKKPRNSDSERRQEDINDHTAPVTGTIQTSGIPGHTAIAVGVLPGMGSYSDSSDDSCSSSDSDDIDTAVFQRPCIAKCTTEGHTHHH